MTCIECGGPIHPERLAAIPNTKTCKHECSQKRQRAHMAAGAKKAMRKSRAAKKSR